MTGHLNALSVERHSRALKNLWNTNGFTLMKDLVVVPSAGRGSGSCRTYLLTSEFTLGRDHSAVPYVGKNLLSPPIFWGTSDFTVGRGLLSAPRVVRTSRSGQICWHISARPPIMHSQTQNLWSYFSSRYNFVHYRHGQDCLKNPDVLKVTIWMQFFCSDPTSCISAVPVMFNKIPRSSYSTSTE